MSFDEIFDLTAGINIISIYKGSAPRAADAARYARARQGRMQLKTYTM